MRGLTEDIERITKVSNGKAVNATTAQVVANDTIEMSFEFQPRNETPALYSGETALVYRGEIFVPVGPPGNGKTSLIEALPVALMASKHNIPELDTLGIKFNSIQKKALIADTERPGDNCFKSYTNIFKRIGSRRELLTEDGKKFKDLDYLVLSEVGEVKKLWQILEQKLSSGEYELLIIDGVLDLCLSMLDDKDSVKVVKRLRALAVKYNCVVVVTIHPNKGTTNPAGHIGAFLIRWCRAMLFVRNTTDKNIKELTADFDHAKLSHANLADFEPVYFTWDQGSRMMVTCGPPAPPMYKIGHLKQAIIELRLRGHHEIPAGILKEHYGKLAGIKDAAIKNHIKKAVDDGLLTKIGEGKATKYLPAADWNMKISDSATDAPYIYKGAVAECEISDTKYPNDSRISDKGYPKEWDK